MMGHPLQGGAHQDALMVLARENLVLKHQLQVALLETTRLRSLCDNYQHEAEEKGDKLQHRDEADDNGRGDKSRTNQSRYWLKDEHQRFMDTIHKFGHKDMKGIASFVGSRNATQVRTHAQKYFMRLARSNKQNSFGANAESEDSDIAEADDLPPLSSLRVETAAAAQAGTVPPRRLERGPQRRRRPRTGARAAPPPGAPPHHLLTRTLPRYSENGSPDSARGSRTNSRAGSGSATEDNGSWDVAGDQELFACT